MPVGHCVLVAVTGAGGGALRGCFCDEGGGMMVKSRKQSWRRWIVLSEKNMLCRVMLLVLVKI